MEELQKKWRKMEEKGGKWRNGGGVVSLPTGHDIDHVPFPLDKAELVGGRTFTSMNFRKFGTVIADLEAIYPEEVSVLARSLSKMAFAPERITPIRRPAGTYATSQKDEAVISALYGLFHKEIANGRWHDILAGFWVPERSFLLRNARVDHHQRTVEQEIAPEVTEPVEIPAPPVETPQVMELSVLRPSPMDAVDLYEEFFGVEGSGPWFDTVGDLKPLDLVWEEDAFPSCPFIMKWLNDKIEIDTTARMKYTMEKLGKVYISLHIC